MDHSLESYLERQPTENLEMLRQQYEDAETPLDNNIALLIAAILKTREKDRKR